MFTCLGEVFEEAARTGGRASGVSCGSASLTYRELLQQGERVAAALVAANVREGDRVAILIDNSIDALAAIVGALCIGAVYVPIDPNQPDARIRLIVNDCGCAAVATNSRLSRDPWHAASPRPAIVNIDNLAGLTRFSGMAHPEPEQVAFILYTSGSTGVPKGVCISHRNLLHFVHWCTSELDLSERDVVANHAPFSFDISTFDIYLAAATRADLRILSREDARQPDAMVREIESRRISVWYSVPSALRLILRTLRMRELDSPPRYVLFAGEVFPIIELQELMQRWPQATFYNLYGPTETNVCTYYRVQPADLHRESPLPIGRPLPGLRAYLIGEDGREVTDHGPGELVIEGPCVTRGYWNDVDSRNLDNHRHGRHATGDLVAWDNDNLVFHGRLDHMVKIDGHRVEVGEIEAVLSGHPEIDEVVVIAAPAEDRTSLVVCYAGAPALSLVATKTFCAEHLPPYMIPHRLVRLEQIPRTASGKVDRLQVARLVAGEA